MGRYAKVAHRTSEDKANELIAQGWELLEVIKGSNGYDGSSITHVLGFSFEKRTEELISIIRTYEKVYGKESIFRAIAEESEEELDLYEANGFFEDKNELTNFMVNYERIVNDQKISYFKKSPKKDNEIETTSSDEDLPF